MACSNTCLVIFIDLLPPLREATTTLLYSSFETAADNLTPTATSSSTLAGTQVNYLPFSKASSLFVMSLMPACTDSVDLGERGKKGRVGGR